MGNKPLEPNFKFYNNSIHPIEGQVAVYSLIGEGTFVMSLHSTTDEQMLENYTSISKENSQKLITFYGATEKKEIFVNCQAKIKENYQTQSVFYWQFLNYDLNSLILTHLEKERSPPPEYSMLSILQNITEGAIVLAKHGAYPQIKSKYIQFTAGREPKLYWKNVLPKNMHRAYFQFFYLSEYHQSLFSPEEIYSLRLKNINHKLNLEKCVVFTLGLVLLEAATGKNMKELYNYKSFQILLQKKDELVESMKGLYSFNFVEILKNMVDYSPHNRPSYLQIVSNIQFLRKLQTIGKDPRQTMSKVSLRVAP